MSPRRRLLASLRCLSFELLLLGLLAPVLFLLAPLSSGSAALCVLLISASVFLGVAAQVRSGALPLAWRCPRLSRLSLRTSSRFLPWPALRAAESALEVLDDDAGYASFFPGARRELLSAAARVLHAHALSERARAVLRTAPPGVDRSALERQEVLARAEVEDLQLRLGELRLRFVAAMRPLGTGEDALPALEQLESRASALAGAVHELDPRLG